MNTDEGMHKEYLYIFYISEKLPIVFVCCGTLSLSWGCNLHDLVFFFFIDYRCNRISKLDANSLNYLDLVHHCVISREKKGQRLKGA